MFKVDPLSCFHIGTYQVFTTQKLFPSEIPQTMKIATLKFSFLIKLPSVKFLLKSLTSNISILEQKCKYLSSIRVFPFFISFFCWNEINKKSSREDTRKIRSVFLWILRNLQEHLFLTDHLQWLFLKNNIANNIAENFFYTS